jgi:multiple sugar transport system permease protein
MKISGQQLLPFLLILPSIVYFLFFFAFPFAQGLWLAFTNRKGELTFTNFEVLISESNFRSAVINTLLLTVTVVPIQLGLALVIALLVNTRLFGTSKFLYICAVPIAISEIAAGIIWRSIFTSKGYLNTILYWLGLVERPITFLSYKSPEYLFMAVAVTEVWRATAIVMVILVAGLQMIHKDYLDAAEVFGASKLQKLTYVILPMLKPSIQTALIIRTVLAFQMFAPILVLTGRRLPVLASEAYYVQFQLRDFHVASAIGIVIMVLSTAFVMLYLKLFRTKWVMV